MSIENQENNFSEIKTTKLKSISEIAENAKNYARAFILEGETQMINNTYLSHRREGLGKAVLDTRELVGISTLESTRFLSPALDGAMKEFIKTTEVCKKYSIGNCYEYAIMALDYMIRNHPDINAEVVIIDGGDHAFLLIGREPGNLEMSWEEEEDVYFCDPWANVTYPAADHPTKTKNFFQKRLDNGERVNCIEDFDMKRHSLRIRLHLSTRHLNKFNYEPHVDVLVGAYQENAYKFIASLEQFHSKLLPIEERLLGKYGDMDTKYEIIKNRSNEIENSIQSIYDILNTPLEQEGKHYVEIYEELQSKLETIARIRSRAITFTSTEHNELSRQRDNKFFSFFSGQSKTVEEINTAHQEVAYSTQKNR